MFGGLVLCLEEGIGSLLLRITLRMADKFTGIIENSRQGGAS